MSDNIELHSFSPNTKDSDDIQEYHEINQNLLETSFSPNNSTVTFNEYDFFTKQDVKIAQKGSIKKKKSKKKDKSSNLMDIISSELASVTVPIEENVISILDYSSAQHIGCLERTPRTHSLFQKARPRLLDSEHGWTQISNSINLAPVYPRILELTTSEDLSVPVQYVKPTMFYDLITENIDNDLNQTTRFLDVEIKNIKFKHHHQFGLEQLLSAKLIEMYDEYNKIKQSLKDLIRDIKINRETRDNLKKELLEISLDKKDDIRFDETVRKYTVKLFNLKDEHINTLKRQKEIVHKIISIWSDIEMVREKVGVKETLYNLVISKNTVGQEKFEKEWNDVFNLELNDLLDKLEYEYVSKYIEYKEAKNTQNLDDSAKRRISRPKLQIDEELLKEEVEETVNVVVSKDEMFIILKHDDKMLSEMNKTSKSLLKHKYYFEIFVDDVFVCESEPFSTKTDKISDVEFTESFSVQILPRNTTLAIVLFEDEKEASSLKIHLVEIRKNNSVAEFVAENFVYNTIIEPNAKNVGSGHNIKDIAAANKVRLKSSNIFNGNLYTNCDIHIKIGWNDNLSQSNDEAVKSSMEVGRQIKRLLHGIDKPNIELLKEIISKVYDRDIKNDETIINTLRNVCKEDIKSENEFPIDENSPEFVRLKLLHLRNIGGFINIDNKLVPIHASQISTEQLSCLQKSKENEFDVQYYSDKYTEMDPIELQRFIGSKYVEKLNKNVLKNLKEHLLRKTHKDVVRDFKDLSFRSLFSTRSSLAVLANISSSTKQQLLAEGISKDQEIRVRVVRAFSLPDRSAGLVDDDDDDEIAGFKVRPLRPFVRLTYHGVTAQTTTAIGCHPTWNQTVKINTRLGPLSSLHINIFDEHRVNIEGGDSDTSQSRTVRYRYYNKWLGTLQVPLQAVLSLGSFHGTFKITTPPIIFGYENLTKESSQSLIPAVTQLMKKDASFITLQITTSLSHLGGLHEYNQPISSDDDYLIKHLNTFVTQYTNDFPTRNISLTFIDSSGKNKCVTHFLQPIPLPDYECFPKNPKFRQESALSKSSGVSKSSSSKSSGRRRDETEKVSYQSGEERESIYSGNEGSWRSGDSQLTRMMDAALRYVALIPTYEVTTPHVVTLMGLELLKVIHGSPLDHTLLLASYFLHLGVRCWAAIGRGLPRGLSSYIITQYDVTMRRVVLFSDRVRSRFLGRSGYVWHVYDAMTGERTELRDVACPLKTVHYVFDNENIWVNVQPSQDCESVCFDFTKSSDWRPVFDKTILVMKQPVVTDSGLYSPPADVERLRQALETKIREKVQKWRPHVKTIWNRYCSSLLREMLPQLEYWALHPTEPKPVPSHRLKQLMATYKIFGFPMNMPYTTTKAVLSTVKSCGAHALDAPNAEFALAVDVRAYPNNVLSVWVLVATITRV